MQSGRLAILPTKTERARNNHDLLSLLIVSHLFLFLAFSSFLFAFSVRYEGTRRFLFFLLWETATTNQNQKIIPHIFTRTLSQSTRIFQPPTRTSASPSLISRIIFHPIHNEWETNSSIAAATFFPTRVDFQTKHYTPANQSLWFSFLCRIYSNQFNSHQRSHRDLQINWASIWLVITDSKIKSNSSLWNQFGKIQSNFFQPVKSWNIFNSD